jgi:FkbM family methyltransferase
MPLKHTLAATANRLLAPLGLHVQRAGESLSLAAAFARLAAHHIPVATVVDVGASDGRWSEAVRRYYPHAGYLLLEANSVHEPALQQYSAARPGTRYVLAVIGDREGELYFDRRDPFGGVAVHEPHPGYEPMPATTIDAQLERHALPGPYLIKLDTHGFELPILEGAARALEQASVLVIETYNFQLQPGALRFHEMIAWLEAKGFRPFDLIEPMHRARDGVLWQFDLLFVRADAPLYAFTRYE